MRPSLQTRFTFFMYRFHPSAYSPFRNPQSVSNFLVCPTCTFEFQRSIPTSLFPIWNANLSCAHDCILSCSQGDPINAALYNYSPHIQKSHQDDILKEREAKSKTHGRTNT